MGRLGATRPYGVCSSVPGNFHMSPRNGYHPCKFTATNTSPLTSRTLSMFLSWNSDTNVVWSSFLMTTRCGVYVLLFRCLQRNPPRMKYLYAFFQTLYACSFDHELSATIELKNLRMCSDSPSYSLLLKAWSTCTSWSSTDSWAVLKKSRVTSSFSNLALDSISAMTLFFLEMWRISGFIELM